MRQKNFPLRLLLALMLVIVLSLTLFACEKKPKDPEPDDDPPITVFDVPALTAFDLIVNGAYPGPDYFFSIDTAAEIAFNKLESGGAPMKLNGKKYAVEAKINLDTDPNKNFLAEGSESEIFFQITEVGQSAPLLGVYYDDNVNQRPGIGLIVGENKYLIPASSLGSFIQKQNAQSAAEETLDIADIVKTVLLPVLFDQAVMDTVQNTVSLTLDLSTLFPKLESLFGVIGKAVGDIDAFLSDLGLDLTKSEILALAPQIKLVLSAKFDDVDKQDSAPLLQSAVLTIDSARDENVRIDHTNGNTIIDFTIPTMNVVATVSKLAIVNGQKTAVTMPDMTGWTQTHALNLKVDGVFNLLGPAGEDGAKPVVHQFQWKLVSNMDPFLMLEKNFLLDDPAFAESGQYFHLQVSHTCTDEEKNDPDSFCSRRLGYSEGSIIDVFYDPVNLDPNIFLSLDNLANLLPRDFLQGLVTGLLGEELAGTVTGMIPTILNLINVFVPLDTQAFNDVVLPLESEEPAPAAALDLTNILDTVKKVLAALSYVDLSDGITVGKGIIEAIGGAAVTDPIEAIGMSIFDIVNGILEGPRVEVAEDGTETIVKDDVQSLQLKINKFEFAAATDYDVVDNAIAKQPDGSYRSKYTTPGSETPFDKLSSGETPIPALKDVTPLNVIDGFILLVKQNLFGGSLSYVSGKMDLGDGNFATFQMMPSEVNGLAGSGVSFTGYSFTSLDGKTYTMNNGQTSSVIAKVIGFDPNVTGVQTIKLVTVPLGGANDLSTLLYSLLGSLLSMAGLDIGFEIPYIPGKAFTTKIEVIPQLTDADVTIVESAFIDIVNSGADFAVDQTLTKEQMAAKLSFNYGEEVSEYTKLLKGKVAAELSYDKEYIAYDVNTGVYKFIKEGTTTVSYTALGITKSVEITIGKKVTSVNFVGGTLNPAQSQTLIAYIGQPVSQFATKIEYTLEGDETVYEASAQPFLDFIVEQLGTNYIREFGGELRCMKFKTATNEYTYSFKGQAFTFKFLINRPVSIVPVVVEGGINMMENWREGITGFTFNFPGNLNTTIGSEYMRDNMYGDAQGRMNMAGEINIGNRDLLDFIVADPTSQTGWRPKYAQVSANHFLTVKAPTSFTANDASFTAKVGDSSIVILTNGLTLTFEDGSTYPDYIKGSMVSLSSFDFAKDDKFIKGGEYTIQIPYKFGSGAGAVTLNSQNVTLNIEAPTSVRFDKDVSAVFQGKVGHSFSNIFTGTNNIVLTFADGSDTTIAAYNFNLFELTDSEGNVLTEEAFNGTVFLLPGTVKARAAFGDYKAADDNVATIEIAAATSVELRTVRAPFANPETSPVSTISISTQITTLANIVRFIFADDSIVQVQNLAWSDFCTFGENGEIAYDQVIADNRFKLPGNYKWTWRIGGFTLSGTINVYDPAATTAAAEIKTDGIVAGNPATKLVEGVVASITGAYGPEGSQQNYTLLLPMTDNVDIKFVDESGAVVDNVLDANGNFVAAGTYSYVITFKNMTQIPAFEGTVTVGEAPAAA